MDGEQSNRKILTAEKETIKEDSKHENDKRQKDPDYEVDEEVISSEDEIENEATELNHEVEQETEQPQDLEEQRPKTNMKRKRIALKEKWDRNVTKKREC